MGTQVKLHCTNCGADTQLHADLVTLVIDLGTVGPDWQACLAWACALCGARHDTPPLTLHAAQMLWRGGVQLAAAALP